MSRYKTDLTGQRFTRVTVLGFSHSNKQGAFWRCRCDCGTEFVTLGSSLRLGNTRSCGCLRVEHARTNCPWMNANTKIGVRVTSPDGSVRDCPSMVNAAAVVGCSKSTISRRCFDGKPYNGFTISKL